MMKIKFRTENGADSAPTFGERRAVALAAGQWDIGQRPMPLRHRCWLNSRLAILSMHD